MQIIIQTDRQTDNIFRDMYFHDKEGHRYDLRLEIFKNHMWI